MMVASALGFLPYTAVQDLLAGWLAETSTVIIYKQPWSSVALQHQANYYSVTCT